VLGLLVVALGLAVLLSAALLGDSEVESKTRRAADPGIGTAASKVVKRLTKAVQAGQGTRVAPRVTGSGPFERAQVLLGRGACREATAEAAQGLAREPRNARGRYLLGAALFCQRMYSEALGAYAGAIALEASLKKDPRLLDELERLARAERYHEMAFDFLEQRIGDAALPVFIRLASSGPRPAIRRRALAGVARFGATSKVDWLASLSLDLRQLKKCQDRALVVEQLRQLKDVRAIPVLRAARDERTGWFGHRMKNYCARKQIAAALRELRALPGAEAYPAN
jgi:tetratricopeptide (TPR) repeat protein